MPRSSATLEQDWIGDAGELASRLDELGLDAFDAAIGDKDFERWAARYFRIMPKSMIERTLALNPVQRFLHRQKADLMRLYGRVRMMVLKARQGGVTTYEQADSLHLCKTTPGAFVLTLADSGGNTELIYTQTTEYAVARMDPAALPQLGDRRSHALDFPALGSHFVTGTAGSEKIPKGIPILKLHGSEFAFWDQPKKLLRTMEPALERPGTTIILETTATGFDGEAHQHWRLAREGKNDYVAVFVPWWVCDDENYQLPLLAPDELGTLADDEAVLVKEHGLTLEQVKWRRAKIRNYGSRDDFFQQYPEDDESCWLASGGAYFEAELLRVLIQRAPPPIRHELAGELAVFRDYDGSEPVVCGCDTAEGGPANDRSTATFRTMRGKLLARYASSAVTPEDFSDIVNILGRRYATATTPALLVIEKNMHGITVLRRLRDKHRYPVGRIYHREILDAKTPTHTDRERIGWQTTEESKGLMLSAGRELFTAALEGYVDVPGVECLKDALAVRRNDKGKFDLNGRDVLVSEMLCWIGRQTPVRGQGLLDMMNAALPNRAGASDNGAPAYPILP